jgi:hypothetical protein
LFKIAWFLLLLYSLLPPLLVAWKPSYSRRHHLSFFAMSAPTASTTDYHGWVHNAALEVNTQSQYPVILGVCISLTLFMVSVVCLRFYVRGIMIRSIGWDDWVVLASAVGSFVLLCSYSMFISLCFALKLGVVG